MELLDKGLQFDGIGSRGRRDPVRGSNTWTWAREHPWVYPCKLVSLDYSKLNSTLLGGKSTIQICSEGPLSSGAIILCVCVQGVSFCVTGLVKDRALNSKT